MHSYSHGHGERQEGAAVSETRGRLLDRGWRYDLEVWFADTFLLRGSVRELRRRVIELTELRGGQKALDVGCGTGTLAIAAAARVGTTGRVAGIDPAPRQIARARAKARRAGVAVDFRIAAIEALPFPDRSFDAVTSTLMLHHLPDDLKIRGLSEIARVLEPGGRLVVAEFAGHDPSELMRSAGFTSLQREEVRFPVRMHRGKTGAVMLAGTKS